MIPGGTFAEHLTDATEQLAAGLGLPIPETLANEAVL